MILEMYLGLMAISFLLLIIGYYTDSIVCVVVGWGFLFIVNSPIINDGIEYHSGDTITLIDDTATVIKNYETFDSKIGFFMAVIGLFGSTYSFYEFKARGQE